MAEHSAANVLYLTINPNRISTTVPTEGWFRELRPHSIAPVVVLHTSGAFDEWLQWQGIPSYRVPISFPDLRRPWQFGSSLLKILRIARRHRIDLVHCNEHDVYPLGHWVARLLGIPVVVSVHFTLRDGFSRWAFADRRLPARIFFVSQSNREACRADVEGVVPEERWRVLYNAIDLNYYREDPALRDSYRRAHHIASEQVVIGCACALRPRKNLEHLFALAERLGEGVQVLVAGGPVDGDEAYAAALFASARRRLGSRLIHVGHLNDLRGFYNALDLFVNTSHEEGFGLSVLEAMACGTPVIGYPSVSVGEVVLPSGGTIVPQGDLDALTSAVSAFVALTDRREARGNARRRAEHFDITAIAADLLTEYQTVLNPV